MSEIHYISRVEYCEVRELTAMTVVKKQFALVPPAANFTRLPMVGLASVEVSDKIENKQRVFVSKLAVFLPERFEVGTRSCASGFGLCPENILCRVQVTARIPSLPPQILYPKTIPTTRNSNRAGTPNR